MTSAFRLVVALAALCSIAGVGCNPSPSTDEVSAGKPAQAQAQAPTQAEPVKEADKKRITDLPQVDLSEFDGPARELWVDLVNDLLSPCGQPVSVARCVAEQRKCVRCVPATRFVARLVDEGYSRSEVQELYRLRYDESTKVKLSSEGSAVAGAPMAAVTIYEFSDFECPHCRMAAPQLKRVLEEYKGKVRLVFKHFPLSQHVNSMRAALASEAAGKQGKFWEMHDLLFENQTRLEPSDIEGYAKKIDLDMVRFRMDIEAKDLRAKIEADKADGRRLEVVSTPSIFVSDRRYELPTDALGIYIKEELDL